MSLAILITSTTSSRGTTTTPSPSQPTMSPWRTSTLPQATGSLMPVSVTRPGHLPTRPVVPRMHPDEYTRWAYEFWYGKLFDTGAFRAKWRPGDFLVVDTCDTAT